MCLELCEDPEITHTISTYGSFQDRYNPSLGQKNPLKMSTAKADGNQKH